jgi:hypothetical protein
MLAIQRVAPGGERAVGRKGSLPDCGTAVVRAAFASRVAESWADSDHVYAVVETPRGSRAKLEFDPKLGVFTLAKALLAGLTYPYDWGFIPSTKAEDGRSVRRAHHS